MRTLLRTEARGFLLREGPAPERRPEELVRGRTLQRPAAGRGLLCGACGHRITSRREAIHAGGAHEHTFTNPAGYVFRVGCFARAPGCLEAGQPTLEHTWFPGLAWRYALCAGCRAHLGWSFIGGDAEACFYGLILDRLREAAGP